MNNQKLIGRFPVVGIGASAGGLDALQRFFGALDSDVYAAFVIVMHIHPGEDTELVNMLTDVTAIPVEKIIDGQVIKPCNIYVMPHREEVTLSDQILRLEQRMTPGGINRSIDRFFISLAEDQKDFAVGIILSGCGTDGAAGVKALHKEGGEVYVQDPKSTHFSYMPNAAIQHDHPRLIERPEELARRLPDMLDNKLLPR